MKNFRLIAVLFIALISITAKATSTDTTGVIKKTNGDMIYLQGQMMSMVDKDICYLEVSGKDHCCKQREVKWLTFGNKYYCAYSWDKTYKNKSYFLYQVVAITKDYILVYSDAGWSGTNDTKTAGRLSIYDKDSRLMERDIKIGNIGIGHKIADNLAMDVLKKYFSSYPELMAKLQKNLDADKLLIQDINGESFGDGAPPISEYINNYADYRTAE